MGLSLVTPPNEEPVSLAEAKAHLRVDTDDEDTLISSLVVAAREYCESRTRRQFVTATWKLTLDDFPCSRCIQLPKPPLQSVVSVTYYDTNGDQQTMATSRYVVDTDTTPGRLCLAPSETSWPDTQRDRAGCVVVTFMAGYGEASQVPDAVRHAMKFVVAHHHENREGVALGTIATKLPMAVDALLDTVAWGCYR